MKDDIVDFVKNIINGLGKVDIHFMCDMLLDLNSQIKLIGWLQLSIVVISLIW